MERYREEIPYQFEEEFKKAKKKVVEMIAEMKGNVENVLDDWLDQMNEYDDLESINKAQDINEKLIDALSDLAGAMSKIIEINQRNEARDYRETEREGWESYMNGGRANRDFLD